MACSVVWRGYTGEDDKWEWGQTCVEWGECGAIYENMGEWAFVDCWDERFDEDRMAGALKTSMSIVAAAIVMAYAM